MTGSAEESEGMKGALKGNRKKAKGNKKGHQATRQERVVGDDICPVVAQCCLLQHVSFSTEETRLR